MAGYSIDPETAFSLLERCPRLISEDVAKQLTSKEFLFQLYHKFEREDYLQVVLGFPYMLTTPDRKLQLFLGQFKKYRFTKEQLIRVVNQSGGLLATKVSNMVGLFDNMKHIGISATEVRNRILDPLPEFALQNRKDLIRLKFETIKRESGRDHIYMRNFLRRHPDIVMK